MSCSCSFGNDEKPDRSARRIETPKSSSCGFILWIIVIAIIAILASLSVSRANAIA